MANEKRLIDANALREKLQHITADVCQEICEGFYKCGLTRPLVLLAISETPTVDAVEVVHGRWRNNENDYPECDKCGYMPQYDPMIDDIWYSPYCPNCGAKMDGDGNGN